MKRNLRLSRRALDDMRKDLLQRQVKRAYAQVPFYRDLFDKTDVSPDDIKTPADLTRLPIITKKDIRRHQQQILNRTLDKANSYRSHTSGSTGEPVWTYFDWRCWYRKKYFSKVRARMQCGMRWGQTVVILESETTRQLRVKNRKWSGVSLLLPVKYLSIFEEPEVLLGKLIDIKPHIIYGPSSCLFGLAREVSRTGVAVPRLACIFTSSEYMAGPVRRYIVQNLGAGVYDVYGSTETKEIAWQCKEAGGYHINEDEVIVEIVDDRGNMLPAGRPGNIVVTDLQNRLMPLIRYRNYDQGFLMGEACPCGVGFALMKPVTGRISEYICLPDGRRLSPFLFTTSIEKTTGLLQYQVIQEGFDAIRVKTIFEKGCFQEGRRAIRSILSAVTHNLMSIELEKCDKIDPEENGKLMVVKNEVRENL